MEIIDLGFTFFDSKIQCTVFNLSSTEYNNKNAIFNGGQSPIWSIVFNISLHGKIRQVEYSSRCSNKEYFSWKVYFAIDLADPVEDKEFLILSSPHACIKNITFPLLVIQGKNEPRVIEKESRELVENLRWVGKEIEYLVFKNEGYDVLKYENRVTCYNSIPNFFISHLKSK